MKIRPATAADSPTLLNLMRELYEHERCSFDREAATSALGTLIGTPALGEVRLFSRMEKSSGISR